MTFHYNTSSDGSPLLICHVFLFDGADDPDAGGDGVLSVSRRHRGQDALPPHRHQVGVREEGRAERRRRHP